MTVSRRSKHLALQVARCPNVANARVDHSHACHKIANLQRYDGLRIYQVPEPWRGDIENAPLLFVSSNPSIDPLDDAPWNTDDDADIVNYYTEAKIAANFPRASYWFGKPMGRSVNFWSGIHAHAIELFAPRYPRPGREYAITEVVHCKSRGEYGVHAALQTCVTLYLSRVLALSRAAVIVCLGDVAGPVLREYFAKRGESATQDRSQVLYLPHTNSRKRRKLVDCVSQRELQLARSLLCGAEEVR